MNPQSLGANCSECPFSINGKPNKPVMGEGPPSPIGILVGEGPGREEAELGRPFVGTTGRQLDYTLAEASLQRDKLYIVNATACQPPIGKTQHQMMAAVRCCRPALIAQLAQFDPNLPTLAMGKWAYVGLTGKDESVYDNRGFINHEFRIPGSMEEAGEIIQGKKK